MSWGDVENKSGYLDLQQNVLQFWSRVTKNSNTHVPLLAFFFNFVPSQARRSTTTREGAPIPPTGLCGGRSGCVRVREVAHEFVVCRDFRLPRALLVRGLRRHELPVRPSDDLDGLVCLWRLVCEAKLLRHFQ